MLTHKKELTNIMKDLVNVVAPSILKIADNNNPDTPVGLLLTTLVTDNFINEKKFIEVQLNLKELKKLANSLDMDKRLQAILGVLV
jgi:mRNA deadenylase 3'-5' endonuclease subunit Ccr4